MLQSYGAEINNIQRPETTFIEDFGIAEIFGIEAVEDTFQRCFRDWKNNIAYLTELVMVLNYKGWYHYEMANGNQDYLASKMAKLYFDNYSFVCAYIYDDNSPFSQEDINYFFTVTD